MKQVTVRVPLRVDLAGGTLDLWPLYLFHPGARTVNVAISLFAEVQAATRSDASIEVNLTDVDHHRTYDSIAQMHEDEHVALIAKVVEHFRLSGVSIVTRTEAPRGSGLGGSSALAVATVRALAEIAGTELEGDELISLVRDLETRLLGIPAGIQDYYPPVYGGLTTLHLEPGGIARHPMPVHLNDLARHLTIYYSGIAHFSGSNNWQIYKRHLDGDSRVIEGLATITRAATDMERALESDDFEAAGTALGDEWRSRRELFDGVATAEIDKAILLGVGAGAWAGKVCGAGGGGSVVFLHPPGRRREIHEALARLPGRILDVQPVAVPMRVTSPETEQKSFMFGSRRRPGTDGAVEHLYRTSESHETRRPYLLFDAFITYDDPRREIHHRVERTFIAPVNLHGEAVDWASGRGVSVDELDLTAEPPAGVELQVSEQDDALIAATNDAEEKAREHLVETERLVVYENPAFDLCSEADESPAAFLLRCTDLAQKKIADRAQRLEATFRRRIDQIRERLEKEQRESEASDELAGLRSEGGNLARGSGQALYNITTGKGTTARDAETVAEADYLEKIALVQKAWDKELEEARAELSAQAEAIEEIEIAPTLRNVEIARIIIVWQ